MIFGNFISLAASALLLIAVQTVRSNVVFVIVPMLIFSFGAGLASPTALAEALGVNPRAASSASGLYGAAQMVTGVAFTTLGGLGGNPMFAVGIVLFGACIAAQIVFWFANRLRAAPTSSSSTWMPLCLELPGNKA